MSLRVYILVAFLSAKGINKQVQGVIDLNIRNKITSIVTTLAFILLYAPMVRAEEINIDKPTGAILNISNVISGSVNLIIVVAGLIAFVYLLLGGIKWITSGGDSAAVETARNQIIQALIGIIVVLAAWALIVLVQQATGAKFGIGAGNSFNLDGIFQ